MLKVNEIFCSIDGEVNAYGQGRRSVFVRFSGCNLDCEWCDTLYAHDSAAGQAISVEELVESIEKYRCHKVTLTGGEPLLQNINELSCLCYWLKASGYDISIETNGSIPVNQTIADICSIIFDYKLPAREGLLSSFYPSNFKVLQTVGRKIPQHFIKFPVASLKDFLAAVEVIRRESLPSRQCCFAPIMSKENQFLFSPAEIISGMQQEGIDGIVNIQLHKLLKMK